MTDKFYRIVVDSRQAETNAKQFDGAMRGAGRSADSLTTSTTRLSGSTRTVETASRGASTGVQQFGNSARVTDGQVSALSFTVNRLAAAVATAISTQQVIEYADAWQSVQGKLRQVTTSQEQLVDVTQQLFVVANDTRQGVVETVDLYTQLRRATEELGLSQERSVAITRTINNAMLASGGSAQSLKAAVDQLGQGLANGALRGQEFNSVAEQAPLILKAIKNETGLTTGELRAFAETGGITAELIVRSLEKYEGAAQKAADAMGQTFGQSLVLARNNAVAFVGASAEITQAVGAAGGAIVTVSQNLDIFVSLIGAVAAVITTRGVVALGAWLAATASATAAQIAQNTAVTTSIGRYGAQVTTMATATAATNAMAAASRGASAALLLVGGPAGAALLAGAALVYFATRASAAEDPTRRLSERLAFLTSKYKELDKAGKAVEMDRIAAETKVITASLEEAQKKLASAQESLKVQTQATGTSMYGFNAATVRAGMGVAELQAKVVRLQTELTALGKAKVQLTVEPESETPGKGAPEPGIGPKRFKAPQVDFAAIEAAWQEGDDRIAREQANTQVLAAELEARTLISKGALDARFNDTRSYYENEILLVQQSTAIKNAELQKDYESAARQRQAQRDVQLEFYAKNGIDDTELRLEFQTQDALIAEIHEQELTTIKQTGVNARAELDKAEFKSRLASFGSLGASLMALGQNQSKGIFKIGKTLALAQAAVALPAAVLQSFQNGGGYPWGLIPAGAMLATGLKNIADIRSAGSELGGGGGGSTPSVSLPSGGGATTPTIPNTAATTTAPQQRRTVDVRIEGGWITAGQAQEILDVVLGSDDNVNMIVQAQSDAQRRGAVRA